MICGSYTATAKHGETQRGSVPNHPLFVNLFLERAAQKLRNVKTRGLGTVSQSPVSPITPDTPTSQVNTPDGCYVNRRQESTMGRKAYTHEFMELAAEEVILVRLAIPSRRDVWRCR